MTERFRNIISVFVTVKQDNKILLHQRKNTGWMDGYYDMPSGHLEPEETLAAAAARELKEETDLEVALSELRLFHVRQEYSPPGKPYIYFFFEATNWSGQPKIVEANKSHNMAFFELDKLPKMPGYIATALESLESRDVGMSNFFSGQ